MRTKPLIGERPWIGPRFLGWGWTPISWEGWASVLVAVALAVAVEVMSHGAASDVATVLIVVVLVVTCIVKGTPPGGPLARRKFREARSADPDR